MFQELIDDEPELKDVFDGFVYFRNAVSAYRQSYPSIPNMLTGMYFNNSRPMWDYVQQAYLSDSSLPRFLKDHGYLSEVYEHKNGMYFHPAVVTNVRLGGDFTQASADILYNIDVALFRYLPHFAKRLVYNNQLWFLTRHFQPTMPAPDQPAETSINSDYVDLRKRPAPRHFPQDSMRKLTQLRYLNQFVNFSRGGHDKPVFKFYHFLGTHLPIRQPCRMFACTGLFAYSSC